MKDFEYALGATPLDPDEAQGLIPRHITTQGELNEWEQQNITQGMMWAYGRRNPDLLSEKFLVDLHKKMLNETWSWAGTFRRSDKNIGPAWHTVPVQLRHLLDDVRYQMEHNSFSCDELVARFHHRLVLIHPFPNGNGRHARLMADLLIHQLGGNPFTWGGSSLDKASEIRTRYINALRSADKGDIVPLVLFMRS